jgi:hypothetical protein
VLDSLVVTIKTGLEIISNISACTKAASGPGKDHGSYFRIIVAANDRLDKFSVHLLRPRIEPFWTIQGDDRDVVFLLKRYLLKRHGNTLSHLLGIASMR